jgi:hypothetical protein
MMMSCSAAVESAPIAEDSCFKQMLDFENSQQEDQFLPCWPSSNDNANVDDTSSSISSGFTVRAHVSFANPSSDLIRVVGDSRGL